MNERELMTTQEVARRLRMSERTLRRWVSSGLLPEPVLPGRWLRKTIDDLLKAHGHSWTNQASTDTDY